MINTGALVPDPRATRTAVVDAPPPPRTSRWLSVELCWSILFIAAYLGLEWLSSIHEHKGVPITPWNPGLGVLLALMIARGPLHALTLFCGVILSDVLLTQSGIGRVTVAAIALLAACSYGAAAAVIRHYARPGFDLGHLRSMAVLLLAGAVAAFCVATGSSALLMAAGRIDLTDVTVAIGPLLVGDMIGIAVMTPAMLRFVLHPAEARWPDRLSSLVEILTILILIGAGLWLIAGSSGGKGTIWFYLLFLPVVVSAVRHGFDGACLSLAATQLGLVALLHMQAYDAATFTEFQLLMLVLTITALTVGVVVSEREEALHTALQLEARLQQRAEDAARAARLNLVSGMASAVAHEINQPMTAVRALARSAQQLMRQPEPDLPRTDRNISMMIEQIDHMAAVIKRVREFLKRGDQGYEPTDLRAALNDSLALLRAAPPRSPVSVQVSVPAGLPAVMADRVQLQQVILNLVRNAIDAVTETGQTTNPIVKITARKLAEPAMIEVSVMDNGPGIGGELAERIFQPLTTSKLEGLGLGLSISASIIQAHGGRMWLENSQPGQTEFRFTLPLVTPEASNP